MDIKKESSTKKLIIDTAYKMINENGYHKTTLRELTKEANLSLGAITHHFKSKSEIINRISLTSSKNFHNEIKRIMNPYDLDVTIFDMVHRSTWLTIYFNDERCTNYYYELLHDNCLHNILIKQFNMQLIKESLPFNLQVCNSKIYAYSLIQVGIISEFIRAKKEKRLTLRVDEMVDIFNRQYLHFLQLSSKKLESILSISNSICKNISYDASDIFNIKLFDNTCRTVDSSTLISE